MIAAPGSGTFREPELFHECIDPSGPVETNSELMDVSFQVVFKLVQRAVTRNGVAAVEVEVGVEVMSDIQASFFEGGKNATIVQQLGFERAPAGFGLRVVIRITRPAEIGQGTCCFDAGAAGGTGVLAATVGVNNQARRGLT